MKLLIFGATGATGQELVKQSLEAGHQVTAFVRTPSKLTLQHQNMTVFEGDVIDVVLVQSAVEGKDLHFPPWELPTPLSLIRMWWMA